MSELSQIKDFIQKVAVGITSALDIDTQVIDKTYRRIAGTTTKNVPPHGGIVKRVLETGEPQFEMNPRHSATCLACANRELCTETGYVHCPITYKGQVVGVMGLICYRSEQSRKLIDKQTCLMDFMLSMCNLIELKLKEHELHTREHEAYANMEKNNAVLNQIINNLSDGYLILDKYDAITHANAQASQILNENALVGMNIHDVIKDPSLFLALANENESSYNEIEISRRRYGVFVSSMSDDKGRTGRVLNFKTVNAIGHNLYGKAFESRRICFDDILGSSPRILAVKELATTVARNAVSILIQGESGTGKELFARAIHEASPRRNNPFIPVNCAAIPMELLESELFGYEEGAFSGARKGGKVGKFEMAHTGTLFLDEIGDMPIYLQAKILRVLQDQQIDRVGGIKPLGVDVRVLAATNKNLEQMLREGHFREDLFYRLSVIPLTLPPLRQRREDLPGLIAYFIQKYSAFFGISVTGLTDEALDLVMIYPWPGNIRELENAVQFMMSMYKRSHGSHIPADCLPEKIRHCPELVPAGLPAASVSPGGDLNLRATESARISQALARFGTSTEGKKKAAHSLGISLTTLYRRLREEGSNFSH